MATFYRGAGIGTYWHERNAQVDGFLAHRPAERPSTYLSMRHIQNGPNVGPYISLTRSYEVAEAYAIMGRELPLAGEPAYVYEIVCETGDRDSRAVELIDPVVELVKTWPDPYADQFYHHDGGQDFLHGVISPRDFEQVLKRNYRQAPPGGGTPRPPNLRQELEVLVRALRDSEVLALRAIPGYCVKNRFPVFLR